MPLTLSPPGHEPMRLEHLLLDYNGTLALDGQLLPGVEEALRQTAEDLQIHVVTADTFGNAADALANLPLRTHLLEGDDHTAQKEALVRYLGPHRTVAVGNGANDAKMLALAKLGIAVVGPEGCYTPTAFAADILMTDILSALAILRNPKRLLATLRK